MTKILLER